MYILLIFITSVNLTVGAFYCLDSVAQQIASDIKPYQISFSTNDRKRKSSFHEDLIIKKIAHGIPAVLVNISDFQPYKKSQLVNMAVFKRPRHVSLHLVIDYDLDNSSYVGDLKNCVNLFVALSPRAIRPKYLFLLINKKPNNHHNFEEFLKYAWSKKFLDTTIVEMQLSITQNSHIIN